MPKKELEQLQEIISPILSKTTKYMMWAFPLVAVSFFNLITLLFFTESSEATMIQLGFFALIGAFGLALSKERKLKQKEVLKLGNDYMIKRIEKSSYLTDVRKKEYISMINAQPLIAINSFIEFVNEEERLMKQGDYS
ncbi:DUF5392 family protein [Bacillus sp. V59.32b]|uniref:DUF5392 family protein n=1 Tax=Bacillus sp. V59.32b TaxID=1758642 RepID=UPI000E3B6503|nr:DUF5392 family protein [Bacillus sp. V59.32b]RFU60230.1 hypothetical protein D0463_17960 [Bacillus sp. V59.32b]